MPNTAEFKDWLFVTVPEDAITFRHGIYAVHCYNSSDESPENDKSVFIGVQYSDWQIIGKGDEISESDWVNIVDGHLSKFFEHDMVYKNYDFPNVWQLITATESGHSLLRSLEMEPGTTLVLKKNEK